MNYLAILDKALDETQADETSGHTWRDFYPDLDPADFEVEELASGISGRRMKGNMVGTVGFFIPSERLKEGPVGQVEDTGEWEASELQIPSQVNPGFVDVWSLVWRRWPVRFRFRFLRCEDPVLCEKE